MKVIDLSFPIHEGMTTFPSDWHPRVEVSQLGRIKIEGRESRKIIIGTHTGTHVDAPSHFIERGETIDQINLQTFIGKALLIDLSNSLWLEEITLSKLKKEISERKTDRLIIRFDWSKHWGSLNYYLNHPFLSKESAKYLVKEGIKLIGIDTPQADSPQNGQGSKEDSPIHKILLGNGIIKLEYMNNLHLLNPGYFNLIAMPLNILGADGSPVRCIGYQD